MSLYLNAVSILAKTVMKECRIPAPRTHTPPKNGALSEEPVHYPQMSMPTTEETAQELRRRLGKELYRVEMDLQGGGRIAGKPCDCLSRKHDMGIEATAEELMSYDSNPIYGQVISWMNAHAPVFQPEAIAGHEPKFYQAMVPEVRNMRKAIMGTESLKALVSKEEINA